MYQNRCKKRELVQTTQQVCGVYSPPAEMDKGRWRILNMAKLAVYCLFVVIFLTSSILPTPAYATYMPLHSAFEANRSTTQNAGH